MEIRVSGHQIDTGEALQSHVSERMQAIADKYFSRAISSSVIRLSVASISPGFAILAMKLTGRPSRCAASSRSLNTPFSSVFRAARV